MINKDKMSVHVYLLNTSSYEQHNIVYDSVGNPEKTELEFKHGPDISQLNLMEKKISQFFPDDLDYDIVVHFVDPNFKLNHYYTEEGQLYFNKLHNIKTGEKNRFYKFHDVSWNYIRDDISINADDIYFFMSTEDFINDYDFFNYLGIKISNNIFINYNITSYDDIRDVRNPYNIFGQESYQNSFDILGNPVSYDEDAVEWMAENGITHCMLLKEAGVHLKERYIQSSLPSWCLNVESHYMKGIILEYEIIPVRKIIYNKKLCVGKTIQEKFLESSFYRFTILDYMIRKLLLIEGIYKDKLATIYDPYTVDLNILLN